MYIKIKRVLDIAVSFAMLVVLSLLMVIIALAIAVNRDGPVLFKQKRPGKNEKIFTVYKFRTMSTVTERDGRELSDMERMTKIGSFLRLTSLDELPQLFNVLRGDMSFIGPRPLLPEYLNCYDDFQRRRHEVMPGITGWAQVNGRNAITWEEKFDLDVWYVEHISLKMDLKIIGKTILNTLAHKDINSDEGTTMEKFTGSKNSEKVSMS